MSTPKHTATAEDRRDAHRIAWGATPVILRCTGGGGKPLAVMPWPGDDETSLALATVLTIREMQAAGRDVPLVDDGSVPRADLDRIARVTGIKCVRQRDIVSARTAKPRRPTKRR